MINRLPRVLKSVQGILQISVLSAICALAQISLLRKAAGLQINLDFGMRAAWAYRDWPGYRSRLLSPALIHLLGGNMKAYLIATFIGLFIGGLLSWRLGGYGIYHAAFALLASPWFQPWDIFEPAIFLAFVILVVESKPVWWFVLLFMIAIFNLQSAMFIPLWMIISRKMLVTGVICMLVGIGIMWFFQHGGPKFGFYVFGAGYGTDYAQERILENFFKLADPVTAGIIVVIAGAAIAVIRQGFAALGLTFLALLAATIVFGVVNENRVYLCFISLLIAASCLHGEGRTSAA
jgi:hypothetical protein